jgi:acyl carrier protein
VRYDLDGFTVALTGRFYRYAEKAELTMQIASANPLDATTSTDRSTDASYDLIKAIVASRLGVGPTHLDDDSRIEQLGLDSMALAEALVAVTEFYAVEIAAETFAARITPVMTLRDLIDAIYTDVQREQPDQR